MEISSLVGLVNFYFVTALLVAVYFLSVTAYKSRGGVIGQGLLFLTLGFFLLSLVYLLIFLKEVFGISLADLVGENGGIVISRLLQVLSFLAFVISAQRISRIAK